MEAGARSGFPKKEPVMTRSLVRRAAAMSILMVLLAAPWSPLLKLWRAIGCVIDPGGLCRDPAPVSQVDIGCGIDPGGGCSR
jgi:hypothetical protein